MARRVIFCMPTPFYEHPTSLSKYVNNIPNEKAVIFKKQYIPGEHHAGFINGIRNAPHYAYPDFQNIAALVQQMMRSTGRLFVLEDYFDTGDSKFEQHRLYAEGGPPLHKVYAELIFNQSTPEPKYLRSADFYLKFQEDGEQLFKSVAGLLRHVSFLHTPGVGDGYSVTFK